MNGKNNIKKKKAAGENHWIVIVIVNMDMDDNL